MSFAVAQDLRALGGHFEQCRLLIRDFNLIDFFSYHKKISRKQLTLTDSSHKSHNALDKYLTRHHFVTITPESYEKIWKENFLLLGIYSLVYKAGDKTW